MNLSSCKNKKNNETKLKKVPKE